jgi:hypothetical protein
MIGKHHVYQFVTCQEEDDEDTGNNGTTGKAFCEDERSTERAVSTITSTLVDSFSCVMNPVNDEEPLSRHIIDPAVCEANDNDEKPLHVRQALPNMWSRNFIGLYSQYAAVGLLWGANGSLFPLCVYVFDGPSNVCANSKSIVLFAWNLKIFYALLTEFGWRPFGLRRKPWMIAGWSMVLLLLLILAFTADQISLTSWLVLQMLVQGFVMLSDVPADGYCVEAARLEEEHGRGQVLATAQRIRFTFCIVAGNFILYAL